MRIATFLVVIFVVALAGRVGTIPVHRPYAAWCAANPDDKSPQWQAMCATRVWCAAHGNQDRITRISCDPMRTRAVQSKPRIMLDPQALPRDLTAVETHLDCSPPFHSREEALCSWAGIVRLPVGEKDDSLLPPGMKTAKLGLYASLSVYVFPPTVVRLGIASADAGTITVSWADNGNGPRVTRSAALNASEIEALIAALDESDFWRSPHDPRHEGVADGEVALVAVGMAGRQNQVFDSVGGSEAVDLSILVHALGRIIGAHWRNVPGGESTLR